MFHLMEKQNDLFGQSQYFKNPGDTIIVSSTRVGSNGDGEKSWLLEIQNARSVVKVVSVLFHIIIIFSEMCTGTLHSIVEL